MFHLYSSSAGSGKTFTLVKTYLALCLKNPENFRHILAITFTNKAAAEMKSRIIGSVHAFLKNGSDAVIDQIISEQGISAVQAAENAAVLKRLFLHSYADLSVMTIDSFLSMIITTFARDLDLPLNFEVQLDTADMTARLVEDLFAEAEPGNFTGDILTAFALEKIARTGSWYLDAELEKIGGIAFNNKHEQYVTALSDPALDSNFWKRLIESVEGSIEAFKHRIHVLAADALLLIEEHGLHPDDFAYKTRSAANNLVKLARADSPDDLQASAYLRKGSWAVKSAPAEIADKIERVLRAGLEDKAAEIITAFDEERPVYLAHVLVLKNIRTQALIHRFLRLSEHYTAETRTVPLSDFPRKIHRALRREQVPFLYWRLGTRYRHIMIDEFQDTSGMQWSSLVPLIEESLSQGLFNMAVGDGKQAVYRWRGGDVSIMLSELPLVLGERLVPERLNSNYRSREKIVSFNNDLFAQVTGLLPAGKDGFLSRLYGGDDVVQAPVDTEQGYVRLSSVELPPKCSRSEETALVCEALCRDIDEVLARGQDYSWGDLAVLVRSNGQAAAVARFLFERGIPVLSPSSLYLISSDAVRFIVSVLSYTALNDRISLYHMWHFLQHDPEEFRRMTAAGAADSVFEKAVSARYAARKPFLRRLPLYEIVEEIIAIFSLNQKHRGFLQGFLEVVLNYSEKHSSDVPAFLHWWQRFGLSDKAALASAERADAVHISTIHKAKGLEYPVVFLPFGWDIEGVRAGKQSMWVTSSRIGQAESAFPFLVEPENMMAESIFSEDYEREKAGCRLDSINLLYVALTRPVDQLYIYLTEKETAEKSRNGKAELKTVGDLLRTASASLGLEQRGPGRADRGSPQPKKKPPADAAGETMHTLPSTSWRRKITVKQRSGDLRCLRYETIRERQDRGLFIHDVLSRVMTEADIPAAVEQEYRLGHLSSGGRAELEAALRAVMDIPLKDGRVGDWFRPGLKVKNERAVISGAGELRPDRVVLKDGETLVIDYKTGARDESHAAQVRAYAAVLRQMGYPGVKACLLYLNEPAAVEV